MRKVFVLLFMAVAVCSAALAQGAQYDIKELTPKVRAILESRRTRFDNLKAMKAHGYIGENTQGYVQILNGGPATREMVDEENADRKALYREILRQNDLPGSALKTVEEIFAGVQREKAAPGDKIQMADGTWVSKQ